MAPVIVWYWAFKNINKKKSGNSLEPHSGRLVLRWSTMKIWIVSFHFYRNGRPTLYRWTFSLSNRIKGVSKFENTSTCLKPANDGKIRKLNYFLIVKNSAVMACCNWPIGWPTWSADWPAVTTCCNWPSGLLPGVKWLAEPPISWATRSLFLPLSVRRAKKVLVSMPTLCE